MKKPTYVYDHGRYRAALFLGWNPRRFRWGMISIASGHLTVSFGFGMINAIRRNYSR